MADDDLDRISDDDIVLDKEPKSALGYLALIRRAEEHFDRYQDVADSIDKRYADLDRLASIGRDREFQIFWANLEVLKPSIYSRAPVPVVTPRFQSRDPVKIAASEVLERSSVVAFENIDLDYSLRLVRDDLATLSRGVLWVRYEEKEGRKLDERNCVERVSRRDFLHDPSRNWSEVDWVAKRSWLTRKEMRKRFLRTSGKVYQSAEYAYVKDAITDDHDGRRKAGVWEFWSKSLNKVVWFAPGCEQVLDEDKPHLNLEGFFPCPRPAYGTVRRDSLIPVPDYVFYKDQIEEINQLTGRIAALTEALQVRGFYPAGASEIGEAIETALKMVNNNTVLIPIANWAVTGGQKSSDLILWLPIEQIVTVIVQCLSMRRQLFEDVYQISGLSDIMRGTTQASETLGAQQLKSQYGSVRIRDRQEEMVRISRDTTRICAEIMAEEFGKETLVSMSQIELRSDADVAKERRALEGKAKQIEVTVKKLLASPEIQQMAQQNPDEAEKASEMAQQEIGKITQQIASLEKVVTIDKVMKLLRDEKLRPYVLDIETDSTVVPDEDAQKQRATEYITAVGTLVGQAAPAAQDMPELVPLLGETLRFAQSQFRVGRQMNQVVDEFIETMKAKASQPKPPDPAMIKEQQAQALEQGRQQAEQAKAQSAAQQAEAKSAADQAKAQADIQALQIKTQAEIAKVTAEAEAKRQESEFRMAEMQAKAEAARQIHEQNMQKGELEITKLQLEIEKVRVSTEGAAMRNLTAPSPMSGGSALGA